MSNDIAKLVLRLNVGLLMLFHGFSKLTNGIAPIKGMLSASSLPEFFAYGVYVGEIIAPLFIALGFYARVSAAILAINMLFIIYLAHANEIFKLGTYGAPVIELPLFYLATSIAIALLGSGKFSLNNR
ncbi:MAG: DoxX family protein [Sulfurimonas sp.]|jgi:putative oxidoreductase|nr:DoxX family protein [Sulfurimonadaceae bacterium]